MSMSSIAAEIIALRLSGQTGAAIERFFADDVVCLDVTDPMTVRLGKADAVTAWSRWRATRTVHGCAALGPWINGDRIVAVMVYDVTCCVTRQRRFERETSIYVVRDELVCLLQHFTTIAYDATMLHDESSERLAS